MGQGPQIWGARGPGMGTTSEGHICLYEAVWTLVFGPIIWWFYALFGHFGQYPQIGHLGSQTPVFGHIPILGSKGISTKKCPFGDFPGVRDLETRRGPDRVPRESAQNVSILGPHFGGPK